MHWRARQCAQPGLGAATFTGAKMEPLDFWLCDVLTVHQAAMLLAGAIPTGVSGQDETPTSYEAGKIAICNALRKGNIHGRLLTFFGTDDIDVDKSEVDANSLREWLAGQGITSGFLFPQSAAQNYLDSKNPRYAPKLAAAVHAWQATGDKAMTAGKSPKRALTEWLLEHASEFGLVDEKGNPNESGIEQVAMVANWQPLGGAPKTPGS